MTNLVKMDALAEFLLGQILSAVFPGEVRLGLYRDYNLNAEDSHLVLFNAMLP